MSRRLILIRHGRVEFSAQNFRDSPRGRQWDPPLGEEGAQQARLLATRLHSLDTLAAVYVSPFRRCLETIAPFAEKVGIEPVLDEDLGEVFVADWEGRSFEEIAADDEELAQKFREAEVLFSLSGGESGQQLRARVRPAVERIIDTHPDGDLVVVSHGGVINAYVTGLLKFPHDMLYLPENTSFNTVVIDGHERTVKFLNDVRHLTSPGLFGASGT
ncbi:MAG: histidine phosphatase family protein [Actinomycetota bacterium]